MSYWKCTRNLVHYVTYYAGTSIFVWPPPNCVNKGQNFWKALKDTCVTTVMVPFDGAIVADAINSGWPPESLVLKIDQDFAKNVANGEYWNMVESGQMSRSAASIAAYEAWLSYLKTLVKDKSIDVSNFRALYLDEVFHNRPEGESDIISDFVELFHPDYHDGKIQSTEDYLVELRNYLISKFKDRPNVERTELWISEYIGWMGNRSQWDHKAKYGDTVFYSGYEDSDMFASDDQRPEWDALLSYATKYGKDMVGWIGIDDSDDVEYTPDWGDEIDDLLRWSKDWGRTTIAFFSKGLDCEEYIERIKYLCKKLKVYGFKPREKKTEAVTEKFICTKPGCNCGPDDWIPVDNKDYTIYEDRDIEPQASVEITLRGEGLWP